MNVQDILKTDQILKAHPEDTLSSALLNIKSAHDAVFVFDDDDAFMGVINPYYSLVKTTHRWDTKLKNCLFHPPRVYLNQQFQEVIRLMVDSKLHYLPVFESEGGPFVGITSARKLLSVLEKMSLFHITIKKFLNSKDRPLIVIDAKDSVAKALEIFRKEKVSKLVVTDEAFKVEGLFTYYELIAALMAPNKREHDSEGAAEIVPQRNEQIKPFILSAVETMDQSDYLDEALRVIIGKNLGSVVVQDPDRRAVGIVTVRDFMNFLKEEEPQKVIELSTQHLSPDNRQILSDYLPKIQRWVDKITDLVSARLIVKEERHGSLFNVTLHLIPDKGDPLVLREEDHHLEEVLKKIKKDSLHTINRGLNSKELHHE
jgi:CBS domain-containing protein